MIERAHHRDLLVLARCRHTQVRPRLGPYARELGVHQRLAFVAVEQNDVAGFGLLFAQLQPQPDPFDLELASLQRMSWPPPTELFCAAPWIIATG
jgi:hypothetical protein